MVKICPKRKQRFIQAYHTHTAPPSLCLSVAECKALAIEHTVTLSRTGSLSSLTLNTLTRTFRHTKSERHTHTHRHTHTQTHAHTDTRTNSQHSHTYTDTRTNSQFHTRTQTDTRTVSQTRTHTHTVSILFCSSLTKIHSNKKGKKAKNKKLNQKLQELKTERHLKGIIVYDI